MGRGARGAVATGSRSPRRVASGTVRPMSSRARTPTRSVAALGSWLALAVCAGCAAVEVPDVPAAADAAPWRAASVAPPDAPGAASLDDTESALVARWLDARSVQDDAAPAARLDVLRLGERASSLGVLAGVLTAGVATLVGVPSGSWDVDVSLRLARGDVVVSGHGSGHGVWALWWGHDWDGARRQARLDALAAALADLDGATLP